MASASKKRHNPEVKAYVEELDEPIRSIVVMLRKTIKATAPDAKEGILWSIPFFWRDEEPSCYVSAAKAHVTLGFTRGAEFLGKADGFTGTGKSAIMKRIIRKSTIPTEAEVARWVQGAWALPPEEEC